jgi:hypothetical protein
LPETLDVRFFRPSEAELSFENPNSALSEMLTRMLVELDDSGHKTQCFLKTFALGGSRRFERELEVYLRMVKSTLAPEARIPRLCGVMEVEDGQILGLLLTYINHRRENDGLLFVNRLLHTLIPLRHHWAGQIQETVRQLHRADMVWGDAKAENVMIDRNNDAWLIGYGGSHTEGWVDEDKVGMKEGHLQGVARVVEPLSNNEYEPCFDSDWGRGRVRYLGSLRTAK